MQARIGIADGCLGGLLFAYGGGMVLLSGRSLWRPRG